MIISAPFEDSQTNAMGFKNLLNLQHQHQAF